MNKIFGLLLLFLLLFVNSLLNLLKNILSEFNNRDKLVLTAPLENAKYAVFIERNL